MHRAVGVAAQHRQLQLLEEQPLAADRRQRAVQYLVTAGGHRHQHHLQARMRGAQQVGGVFALPKGERALAGGDADRGHAPLSPVETWRVDCGPDRSHMGNERRRGHGPDYRRLTISLRPATQRRLTSSGWVPWRRIAWTWPSGSRRSSTSSWRATRQLRWMRTKRSPNSSSSDLSDSSIRSSPRAWCTTTYFSSACR